MIATRKIGATRVFFLFFFPRFLLFILRSTHRNENKTVDDEHHLDCLRTLKTRERSTFNAMAFCRFLSVDCLVYDVYVYFVVVSNAHSSHSGVFFVRRRLSVTSQWPKWNWVKKKKKRKSTCGHAIWPEDERMKIKTEKECWWLDTVARQ